MDNNYKIAVFYYTQTGQLLNILRSLLKPLENEGCTVIYKTIEPVTPFPFHGPPTLFIRHFPSAGKVFLVR